MSSADRDSRKLGKRAKRSQAADSPVRSCSPEHGVYCDGAWAAITKKLGLSPQQVAVARCVLAGNGERHTAEALGLSPGTVQTHLERLYAKLKIHSRTELATRLCAAYHAWRTESPPPTDCPENT